MATTQLLVGMLTQVIRETGTIEVVERGALLAKSEAVFLLDHAKEALTVQSPEDGKRTAWFFIIAASLLAEMHDLKAEALYALRAQPAMFDRMSP